MWRTTLTRILYMDTMERGISIGGYQGRDYVKGNYIPGISLTAY